MQASQAKRRAAMGEEAWLEYGRQKMARSRERRGRERERAYNRAARRAAQLLIDRHHGEYEHLLAVELALAEAPVNQTATG